MDTSKKIIRGIVNSRGLTITSPITQWDYGWQFIPEIDDLPPTYRLDFSNEEKKGTALPIYCSTEGAEVPTELIDTGKDVWVWYVAIGEGYGITEYKWRIPNKCKPKTEQDEPTPSQQSSIDQLITRSNEAVESAEQSASDASASAQASAESAQASGESALSASNSALSSGEYASNALGHAESASQSAQASANSASASAQSAQSAEQSAQTASAKADSITGLTAQATTLPDGSSATASYNAETGVMSFGIPKGKDGTNGDDGYSPTANVSKSGKVATITITDKTGTTSAQVSDGTDGTDGVSPTVTITPITGGHRITITDADGEHSADIMDGTGNVDDVQINGTSIVSDGVANVPMGSASTLGVFKTNMNYGTMATVTGFLQIASASSALIKSGYNAAYGEYRPLTPNHQHESTFYGLAKSAGDTTQSQSSNAVGTYTESAKTKIQDMIGIDDWQLAAEETLAEDGYFDITIANSAREVYIYAEIEIASNTTSLVAEAYNDSGTRVYYQTFGNQINATKKAITVLQLIPIATEIKALVYSGEDVNTNSGHFDWQHKSFNIGKLNRFRITAYGGTTQIPTGSIVRVFAR